mmetsp:Transcript_40532/g.72937  ORF Transcript_40532/g.72937 Transcript_40532/m.72937 type:complete len:114 (+) Transcript_40532:22-363(+)
MKFHNADGLSLWMHQGRRASAVFNVDCSSAAKICSVVLDILRSDAAAMIEGNPFSTALLWYGSDGWGARTMDLAKHSTALLADIGSTGRKAYDKKDFCLQRGFYMQEVEKQQP